MVLATVQSATLVGVSGAAVTVEVHVARGLPGFTIVGLPDASCRESRDRVRAAVTSSGLEWPSRRVTVNLAPSDVRKVGAGLDLAIAVGVLVASEQLPRAVLERGYLGELGLNGDLRGVAGVLAMVRSLPTDEVVVPAANGAEAAVHDGTVTRPMRSLRELLAVLRGQSEWPPVPVAPVVGSQPLADFADVRGQPIARRALEVAAAGGHHALLVGPPGTGKTMLAERMPSILGDLSRTEAAETLSIRTAAGERFPDSGLSTAVPFRAPHHTASTASMVGGGSHHIRPGEVSLAHRGVLFLDELAEFSPSALDALRQPLEQGVVRVARAHATVEMPAQFQLVAAMNPCPCGARGHGQCRCGDASIMRYRRRVSGPLLDRFDIRVVVTSPTSADVVSDTGGESSASVRARVVAARDRAHQRGVGCNRELSAAAIEAATPLSDAAAALAQQAVSSGLLSGRGFHRVRSVVLTMKDLAGVDGPVTTDELAAAMALRCSVPGDHLGGGVHDAA